MSSTCSISRTDSAAVGRAAQDAGRPAGRGHRLPGAEGGVLGRAGRAAEGVDEDVDEE